MMKYRIKDKKERQEKKHKRTREVILDKHYRAHERELQHLTRILLMPEAVHYG